jgi:hypothetical protein
MHACFFLGLGGCFGGGDFLGGKRRVFSRLIDTSNIVDSSLPIIKDA